MCVRWFGVEACFKKAISETDSDIQKEMELRGWSEKKTTLDVGMSRVAEGNEVLKFFFSMRPYEEYVVDVSHPDERFHSDVRKKLFL